MAGKSWEGLGKAGNGNERSEFIPASTATTASPLVPLYHPPTPPYR